MLPPRPVKVPILLIRRPTREAWAKRVRRAPLVVNRYRLGAAFRRLLASHTQYNGASRAKPDISNLDRYYTATDPNGDLELKVGEMVAPPLGEVVVGRATFVSWVDNESSECARSLKRWLISRFGGSPRGEDWDVVRREIAALYPDGDEELGGGHPAAHAPGAAAIPASWIAALFEHRDIGGWDTSRFL